MEHYHFLPHFFPVSKLSKHIFLPVCKVKKINPTFTKLATPLNLLLKIVTSKFQTTWTWPV